MSIQRIATRYAKSLLDLAKEQGKLDRVIEDIKAFKEACKNRDLYLFLKSPIINAGTKQKAFKALFEGKLDPMTMAFMNIIFTKGREPFLPEIANEFIATHKQLNNISTVKLITAVKVDQAAIDAIIKKFESSASTRTKVEVENIVKPDIIGGFKVEFEDKLYDASIKYQLDQLKQQFTGNPHKKNL
jgi:F-type H+-transporting ATPase subunit delta